MASPLNSLLLRKNVVRIILLTLGVAAVLVLHSNLRNSSTIGSSSSSSSSSTSGTSIHKSSLNDNKKTSDAVRKARKGYKSACQDHAFLHETLREWYTPPHRVAARPVASVVNPCQYTFLDFGANVGDSMGKFIDAGVPVCDSKTARYDVTDGYLKLDEKGAISNKLTNWVKKNLHELSGQVGKSMQPEDYCYYGIEGNPVFTKQLQQLESRVINSSPRPLQSAHFFTETIGAGADGPATLFLDTVNADQNYWGSSVYATHQDVQASSSNKEKKPVAAKVSGTTLTSLVSQTVLAEAGSHLLVKMDIEGSEYAVLNEAYASGVLCDLVMNRAVRVDLLVEVHPKSMLGDQDADFETWNSKVWHEFSQCGVNLVKGRSAGR